MTPVYTAYPARPAATMEQDKKANEARELRQEIMQEMRLTLGRAA